MVLLIITGQAFLGQGDLNSLFPISSNTSINVLSSCDESTRNVFPRCNIKSVRSWPSMLVNAQLNYQLAGST